MLYLYNELNYQPWNFRESKNALFSRLELSMNKLIGIDIRKKGVKIDTKEMQKALSKDSIDSKISMVDYTSENDNGQCANLIAADTSLSFDRKTLNPVIITIANDGAVKKNNNVCVASFDISNKEIVNVFHPWNALIYQYDYDRELNCFSLVFNLMRSQKAKGDPKFSILWREINGGNYYKTEFSLDKTDNYVFDMTRVKALKPRDNKSKNLYFPLEDDEVKLRIYWPSKPCYNIICTKVSWKDKLVAMLDSKFKMNPEGEYPYCKCHYPSGSKELKDLTNKLRFTDHVTAVTYFVHDLVADNFNEINPQKFLKDRFATNFDRVSILSRDGKIYYI